MTNDRSLSVESGVTPTGASSAVVGLERPQELVSPTQFLLRQRIPAEVPVGVPCVRAAEEVRRIGAWLAALEAGCLAPTTLKQQEFVAMCSGRREPEREIEHLWRAYMLRRYSDRRQVCICASPDEKSCQYDTGWTFRGLCICVRCGWAIPRRKGRPNGRRWVVAATEALRTAHWFIRISTALDQLPVSRS